MSQRLARAAHSLPDRIAGASQNGFEKPHNSDHSPADLATLALASLVPHWHCLTGLLLAGIASLVLPKVMPKPGDQWSRFIFPRTQRHVAISFVSEVLPTNVCCTMLAHQSQKIGDGKL